MAYGVHVEMSCADTMLAVSSWALKYANEGSAFSCPSGSPGG